MSGLQNAMVTSGTLRTKNLIWRHKNRKYASRLLSFVAQVLTPIMP